MEQKIGAITFRLPINFRRSANILAVLERRGEKDNDCEFLSPPDTPSFVTQST
jgi:hypothetical protein